MWVAVCTLFLFNSILLVYTIHRPVSDPRFLVELRKFLESKRNVDTRDNKKALTINYKANPEEDSGLFQGDILLTQEQIDNIVNDYSSNRNAIRNPELLWPNNTIIYELYDDFDEEQLNAIFNAIRDIKRNTCIKFRQRNFFDLHYVRLTGSKRGCFSHVGYAINTMETPSYQILNLAMNVPGKGCFRHGTIVHEFFHVLGLHHMQSTHNRDKHIQVLEENVNKDDLHNFVKYTVDSVTNLDVPYDHGSVMHYGPYAFSANGDKTIIPHMDTNVAMGQRSKVQASDWLRINRLYNCKGAWDEQQRKETSTNISGNNKDKYENSMRIPFENVFKLIFNL